MVKKTTAATDVAEIDRAFLESARARRSGEPTGKNAAISYTIILKGFLLAKEHGYENNFVDYRHYLHCRVTDADWRI
ncbi:hypothetical protein PG877_13580 [Pantoea piersonii]|uniref:hypothetical protein n=1 Tax=Pantoea piersonii TaxID=2364647 RepID=UPI0022F1A667|nr:hypothetical protein [Pantoea piersonii]WBV20630.1 hypothetical protein PG877_13580 [Pantoea piersonii]